MDATLAVPANFVPHVRRGLFGEWGAAAEKLASLALQFGSGAPDGIYMPPLQTFFTLCVLLGEVGWKDGSQEKDVVMNLGIGAPHIIKGLQEEHLVLIQQLEEMPAQTSKGIRDAAAGVVAGLEEFIQSVETQALRARRRRLKPTPIQPTSWPPHSTPAPSRARRASH